VVVVVVLKVLLQLLLGPAWVATRARVGASAAGRELRLFSQRLEAGVTGGCRCSPCRMEDGGLLLQGLQGLEAAEGGEEQG